MQNTTRLSSPRLKDRKQRRLERIRARERPSIVPAKAAACRASHSICTAVFAAEAAAVATVAMTKTARNISEVMEVARKASECPSDPVLVSLAECLALGPRTAKRTLQRFLPPLQ